MISGRRWLRLCLAPLAVLAAALFGFMDGFLSVPAWAGQQASAAVASPADLDFEFFREHIQPIFLKKRQGRARCYICHSRGTPFRLQPLSPGSSFWNEEESRLNFEAAKRLVVPGEPLASLLLKMPLASGPGGELFHPGGKHWSSQDDPEWQLLSRWVEGRTR